MSLPIAQLGQLPSMNFSRPQTIPKIEPAWHKALTALLVNTAGNAAQTGVSNAMARDYSKEAIAAGLPGTEGETPQSFLSQVMHGPQWDKTALHEGMRAQTQDKRYDLQDREK